LIILKRLALNNLNEKYELFEIKPENIEEVYTIT
jgi:hypothetical protein